MTWLFIIGLALISGAFTYAMLTIKDLRARNERLRLALRKRRGF